MNTPIVFGVMAVLSVLGIVVFGAVLGRATGVPLVLPAERRAAVNRLVARTGKADLPTRDAIGCGEATPPGTDRWNVGEKTCFHSSRVNRRMRGAVRRPRDARRRFSGLSDNLPQGSPSSCGNRGSRRA